MSGASTWRDSTALWAGVAISFMWLAVLLIGLFGGDIVTNGGGALSTVPVVAAVVPFAFVATIVVAVRGFAGDARRELEEERHAREALQREVAELRTHVG